jgi:predicted CoA-binding protein
VDSGRCLEYLDRGISNKDYNRGNTMEGKNGRENIRDILKEKTWAVVGASANTQKFGYKVFKRLIREGYTVYPVNPNCKEIEGVQCYGSLKDLSEMPGAVSVIVPPKAGLGVLDEAAELGIKRLWFQPGAESGEIVGKAEKLGLQIIYGYCVLVELG